MCVQIHNMYACSRHIYCPATYHCIPCYLVPNHNTILIYDKTVKLPLFQQGLLKTLHSHCVPLLHVGTMGLLELQKKKTTKKKKKNLSEWGGGYQCIIRSYQFKRFTCDSFARSSLVIFFFFLYATIFL